MRKDIKLITIFIFAFFFFIFLFNTKSYAGTQKLNDLNYTVTLNEDGTADIIEKWDIRVSDTNTLFKTFDLNSEKYGDITNVKVSEITNTGDVITFTDTGKYEYHVQKGGYYALKTKATEFEIAWGVSISDTLDKTYEISYRINDAIKNYSDCSEFYWQFVSKTNGISANKVTGTIKLPKAVISKENLRVWAHGPLNGNIEIVDNETVSFEVSNLHAETMVEVRVVLSEDIFTQNTNIAKYDKLENILIEEMRWSNEANRERKIANLFITGYFIIGAVITLFFAFKIVKYIKISRKTKKMVPEQEFEYFREFPDETATPAEAAFLYYFDKNWQLTNNLSKVVSATILDLALKGAIMFEKDEKDNVYIILTGTSKEQLKKDEQSVYEILQKTREYSRNKKKNEEEQDKISMKDIENYAKRNDTAFLSKIEKLPKIAQVSEEEKGNYDKGQMQISSSWTTKSIVYFIVGIFLLFILPFAAIPFMICGILCNNLAKKSKNLTQKGTNELEKWKALKRYMEEFSLLNEREVPELVLWEKYLVYATAFGIADKVLKQLKLRYPELADESYMLSSGYTYMYMMNRMNFDRMIVSSIQKAYNTSLNERAARNYSSRKWTGEEDFL